MPLRRVPWPALIASAAVLAAAAVALRAFAAHDPLRRSWRAIEGQPYTVRGESRVEHGAVTTRFRVAGTGDGTGRLALDIAPLGGETAADRTTGAAGATALAAMTATYTVDGPSVVASDGVTIPLRALGARLPVGDPLVLLATAHAPRGGALEPIGDGLCRRVDFVVGARAYGTWWEAHPAYLPVNANAGGLWTFEGEGTAWIDPDTERPCRIEARVRLPRLVDDSAGRGWVAWTYDWG
ncbi:MAG: hypothetical protein IPG72_01150 [Ardenticatenales bacterium]|nr:hypothetical protein [Ardenticatenales bacterium]